MAVFSRDTFTVAADTALQSHAGEAGGWSLYNGSSVTISGANDNILLGSAISGGIASPAPAGPNHLAELSVLRSSGALSEISIFCRYNTATSTGYRVAMTGAGDLALIRDDAGVPTVLASAAGVIGLGVAALVRLEVTDTAKRVLVDGAQVLSSADNTIAVTGVTGFFGKNPKGGYFLYIDNWLAGDIVAETVSQDTSVVITAGAVSVVTQQDTSLQLSAAVTLAVDTLTTITPAPPYVFHAVQGVVTFDRGPARPAMTDRQLQPVSSSAAGERRAGAVVATLRPIAVRWPGMATADLAAFETFLSAVAGDLFLVELFDGVRRTVRLEGALTSRELTPDRHDVSFTLLELVA